MAIVAQTVVTQAAQNGFTNLVANSDSLGVIAQLLYNLNINTTQQLIAWTAGNAYQRLTQVDDGTGYVTSASVLWPDGSTGTYTSTIKNQTFGVADAYTVTYARPGYNTITVTQAQVTRDANGVVTIKPALTAA